MSPPSKMQAGSNHCTAELSLCRVSVSLNGRFFEPGSAIAQASVGVSSKHVDGEGGQEGVT